MGKPTTRVHLCLPKGRGLYCVHLNAWMHSSQERFLAMAFLAMAGATKHLPCGQRCMVHPQFEYP